MEYKYLINILHSLITQEQTDDVDHPSPMQGEHNHQQLDLGGGGNFLKEDFRRFFFSLFQKVFFYVFILHK